jgi:hypothetical protein
MIADLGSDAVEHQDAPRAQCRADPGLAGMGERADQRDHGESRAEGDGQQGSIRPRASTLPNGAMTAMTAMTALAGAAPASTVPPTIRLTVSPVLKDLSSPGPQRSTWPTADLRSQTVPAALAVPVASWTTAPDTTITATSRVQPASHLAVPSAGTESAPW